MSQMSTRFYVEFYGVLKMLVSTISNIQGEMVGRDGFEPSTNWLKGTSINLHNQRVSASFSTANRHSDPLRINSLRLRFTEFLSLKTLHPQSRFRTLHLLVSKGDCPK